MTGEPSNLVSVDLSAEEAELFKLFRQYQGEFQTLINAGVFNMKHATAEIYANKDAQIQTVTIHFIAFKKD